ncbi:hypothetical protein FNF29_02370 [Cafeteria roenbergensis]|uniref:Thioredoxin-like fold domain-containing protein n=1 Tax=Cafeteria roenbergensis TaxID=33653 RepID=A0A5A8CMZ8_CAFRO|nr:hypothetical protein FNF29_02370 [Cafeteria roenbergensis]|eukprot:KAA0154493.1 hypothetical protein FNF29_02370 [Cafeteria roenbergensis]
MVLKALDDDPDSGAFAGDDGPDATSRCAVGLFGLSPAGPMSRRELRDAELAASAARRASMPSLSLFPGEKSGARSNGAAKPRTRLLARLAGLRRSLARDEAELAGSTVVNDPWAMAALGASVPAIAMGGFLVARFMRLPHSNPKASPLRAAPGEEGEMFVLYQSEVPIGGPSASMSMFCIKVEAFLRAAKIPFCTKPAMAFQGPKGKLPFAKHGSTTTCDSHYMLEYLLNTFSKKGTSREHAESTRKGDAAGMLGDLALPGTMDARQLAVAKAIEVVIEHRLYYNSMMHRWIDDSGFGILLKGVFSAIPAAMRMVMPYIARRKTWDAMVAQGVATHHVSDVDRREIEDWDTVATLFETSGTPFLGGDAPCPQDCTLFAALDSLLNTPFPSKAKDHVIAKHPALVEYADAFRARFFPDAGPVDMAVRRESKFVLTKP